MKHSFAEPILNLRYSQLTFAVALCAFILLFGSCGSSDDTNGDGSSTAPAGTTTQPPSSIRPAEDRSDHPWKIVVSMPIFADMARIIGDDQVTVSTLIPLGVDPHTYVPTDDHIAEIQAADIIFVNGLGADQPTWDFIEAHHPDKRLFVVDFARNVPSPTHEQPPDLPIYAKDVGDDPHLWLDPQSVPIYAETISHSLIIIDGINQAFYHQRYLDYAAQIAQMGQEIATKMQALPAGARAGLITQHNSLVHFARRYGLTVAATIADNGEDGVRAAIADTHPPALFAEAGFDDSTLKSLAQPDNLKVCTLYTDTITDENMSYLQMMEYDADQIASCLGG